MEGRNMFKNNEILKQDILNSFMKEFVLNLDLFTDSFKNILKNYEDDKKIELIDYMIVLYQNKQSQFYSQLNALKLLCEQKANVFTSSHYVEVALCLESIRKPLHDLESSLLDFINRCPASKSDKILLWADKIKLFDEIFVPEDVTDIINTYCYYYDESKNGFELKVIVNIVDALHRMGMDNNIDIDSFLN